MCGNCSSLLGPAFKADDLPPGGSGPALPSSDPGGAGAPAQQESASPGCERCVVC